LPGDLTVNGTFTNVSDRRLKINIVPLKNSLGNIARLNGYHYNWKSYTKLDTATVQTGLIAQELELLFPELIKTDHVGFKSVNYIGLIPHLVEAIKELKAENELLKAENEKVKEESKTKLSTIEARLTQIEKMMEGNKDNAMVKD
jgi:hypothetical protein